MFTSSLAAFWLTLFGPGPVVQQAITPPARPAPIMVASAPTADEVIKSVQGFYATIKQVTAMFRQQVTNVTFGDTKTSDGKVWIAKPGKMRWDYYSKPKGKAKKVTTKKSFISNGNYLYVVEHDNKQVVKKNLDKDLMPVAISFLYGKGDLATDFTGKIDNTGKYGSKDEITLELTPKKPSAQYKKLFLVVDPGNYRVKQSIIVDSADNVNHFRFYTPDFDKAVDAKWFEFDPESVPSYRKVNADDPTAGNPAAGSGSAAPAPAPAAGSGSAAKPAPTK